MNDMFLQLADLDNKLRRKRQREGFSLLGNRGSSQNLTNYQNPGTQSIGRTALFWKALLFHSL